jgi:two-component system LytT family sensor kinase
MWLAFWASLFLIGVKENRWEGSWGFWQMALEYATAALVSTAILLTQISRSSRFDLVLGRPILWLARLWKWLPIEVCAFAIAMFAVPRVVDWLCGERFDDDSWLEDEAVSTAKFLLFYLLAGVIQFGFRSYAAWATERVRVAEQARLTQQAQLTQLTQQLQPHFLFNGLNIISSLIHSDPTLADALLGRLSELLRAATSAGRNYEQTLDDELVLLRAYAELMTQRFAGRFQLEWAIDDDTRECLVPTLCLQPLLENCFHHVVQRRKAPTHIAVRSRREAGGLHIEVEDDGEHRAPTPPYGVGLSNLQQRLDCLHGTRGHLTLLPGLGKGLIVRMDLPCRC